MLTHSCIEQGLHYSHQQHSSNMFLVVLVVQELHSQLDGEVEDAHFDINSWSQFFTPEANMG